MVILKEKISKISEQLTTLGQFEFELAQVSRIMHE
jgi:hypothetical protein